MITIRRISLDDAELLRAMRLRALSDSPLAFGSNYARELAFDNDEWNRRCVRMSSGGEATTLFALDESRSHVDIIGCLRKTDEPETAIIVSMWIAPERRREGLAKRLVDAVEAWAIEAEYRGLFLDVVENNLAAIQLYLSCGFAFSGESCIYANQPGLRQLFMRKTL